MDVNMTQPQIPEITIIGVEVIIGIVSGFGNALIVFLIWYHRRLQTTTNYLIASLAAADCLVGFIGMPLVIISRQGLPNNFYGCTFSSCVIIALTQISIFCLLAIALERFAAIKFPVFHRNHCVSNQIAAMTLVVWLGGAVVGFVPLFGWHAPKTNNTETFMCGFTKVIDYSYLVYFHFFIFVLIPIILMFIAYGYIYKIVRDRGKIGHVVTIGELSKRKLSREFRVAKRLLLILIVFVICWMPIHIMNCVTYFLHKTHIPLLEIAIILSLANSGINPFLYAFTNRGIKNTLLDNYCGCCKGMIAKEKSTDDKADTTDNSTSGNAI